MTIGGFAGRSPEPRCSCGHSRARLSWRHILMGRPALRAARRARQARVSWPLRGWPSLPDCAITRRPPTSSRRH